MSTVPTSLTFRILAEPKNLVGVELLYRINDVLLYLPHNGYCSTLTIRTQRHRRSATLLSQF
ncbi:hypothetical protein J6590_091941 [Homalodisca vitripennis]|nr:hypothetical protein J6590_091941 [Homalodisca vitripennis]